MKTSYYSTFFSALCLGFALQFGMHSQELSSHLSSTLIIANSTLINQAEIKTFVPDSSSDPENKVNDPDFKSPEAVPYTDWLDQPTELELKEDSRFSENFFKMLTVLVMTIVFMIAATWAVKKLLGNRLVGLTISGKGRIQIREQKPLSAKSMLYIINIEGQEFLISEAVQQGVHLLARLEISDKKSFEAEMEQSPR